MGTIRQAVFLWLFFCMGAQLTWAAETTIKVATLMPDGSAWMKILRQAGDDVALQTENRVQFKYYPAGVMGDDKAVLRKIRIGQLHGAAMTVGAFEKIYPDSQIYTLPMAFESFEQVDAVRARLDEKLILGFAERGFITFGFAEGGFAYPMSKASAVRSPEDLKRLKVWAPMDDEMSVLAFSTIEVTPIPLTLGDVLTGLQTGLVDTIASPPIPALVMQWHTQVKYLTEVPISYVYGFLAIDQKVFSKLSAGDQKVVDHVMRSAFLQLDLLNRQDGLNALNALQQQGIEIVLLSEAERSEWRRLGLLAQKKLQEKKTLSPDLYSGFKDALSTAAQKADTSESPH